MMEDRADQNIDINQSSSESWTSYEQRLQILEKFSELRRIRQQVAQTMIVPDINDPASSFFYQKIPLSLIPDDPSLSLFFAQSTPEHQVYAPSALLNSKVALWTGDITQLQCDAICIPMVWNFAPEGGGLTAFVFTQGGPALQKVCEGLGPLEIGQTKVTGGFQLPCKVIFHTAPPSFRQVNNPYDSLQSCYETALEAASSTVIPGKAGEEKKEEEKVKTLAFAAIGTGARFNQPPVEAAHIALRTTRRWLEQRGHVEGIERIVFVVRNARQQEIYEQLMMKVYFPVRAEEGPKVEGDIEELLNQLPSPPQ